MHVVELTREAVVVRRRFGRTRTIYHEELVDARATGSRLDLTLADRSSLTLRIGVQAEELAESIGRIVGREPPAPAPTVGRLAEYLQGYCDLLGFSALPFCDVLLTGASSLGASDLHLAPTGVDYALTMRLHGAVHTLARLDHWRGRRTLNRLKVMAGVLVHEDTIIQEGRAPLPTSDGDARLTFVPAALGESATVRLFDRLKRDATLDDLGFDPETLASLRRLVRSERGLVVVCGSSASGKTTTLYTAVRELLADSEGCSRTVSVEDPVECCLPGMLQLEVNDGQGNSYAALLRSVLRQDANVIVVGEIRDPETAELAVRAALTGHLVLTTLHAGSAAEALLRLLDLGVGPNVLASAVEGVICQRLVRVPSGRRAAGEAIALSGELRDLLEDNPRLDGMHALVGAEGRAT